MIKNALRLWPWLAAVVFALFGVSKLHHFRTDRIVVLDLPIVPQSGATFSAPFTVDRTTRHDIVIECEITRDIFRDVEDALIDGIEAEAYVTVNGVNLAALDCDPEHRRSWQGHLARIFCTFRLKRGKTYDLAFHIVRYGQGISSRDHKLAGTWDENLILPADAHPRLKVEGDPLEYKSIALTPWLLFLLAAASLLTGLGFAERRTEHSPQ